MLDPNQGNRTFSGSCKQLDSWARQGRLSNNMCGIARLRLDAVCCSNPTHTDESLYGSWTAHRGG